MLDVVSKYIQDGTLFLGFASALIDVLILEPLSVKNNFAIHYSKVFFDSNLFYELAFLWMRI